MQALVTIIISSIAVFVTAYILPGVHLQDFTMAIVVGVILGFINTFIRPILFLLTLPINIITLGLFTFVIMGFMVSLVSFLVPGFTVDNFLWAIAFAFVFAIFNGFLNSFSMMP